MSQKAEFHRAVGRLAREPAAGDVFKLLVRELDAVVKAFDGGDAAGARELLGDIEARGLLRQALPWWSWRDPAMW